MIRIFFYELLLSYVVGIPVLLGLFNLKVFDFGEIYSHEKINNIEVPCLLDDVELIES